MMSLSKFGISVFIPSYKRSSYIKTHKLFLENDCNYVVRLSEVDLYKKYCNNVIGIPDFEINSLAKVRQKIIDISPTNLLLQVDDDIDYFIYKNKNSYIKLSMELLYTEIIRIFDIISDLKLGLWSLTSLVDVRTYHREFLFKGIIGGMLGFNKLYIKSKYDENCTLKVDSDFLMQELLYNRIVIIPDYIGMAQKRDTNIGGNNIDKSKNKIYEANEYLKTKWGSLYDFDYNKNIAKINIKR